MDLDEITMTVSQLLRFPKDLPWSDMFTGGLNPPTIDFEKTERKVLSSLTREGVTIQRYWDLQIRQLRVTSLAVHRNGFIVEPFTTSEAPEVQMFTPLTVEGLDLHNKAKIYIGSGAKSVGLGYKCFVVLPKWFVGDHGKVSPEVHCQWMTEIMIPSIALAVPPELQLNIPNHQEAETRYNMGVTDHGILVEEKYLQALSTAIRQFAEAKSN